LSVSVDCSQDSARFNWTTSIGAIFYIAVAEDANGNIHSCNSMGTNCLIEGLRCGHNYTGSIIGTNLKCNSTASEEVTFMTGRSDSWIILDCTNWKLWLSPNFLQTSFKNAYRDCNANHALIVWQNHKPTGLYTAVIEDQSGAQLNCTSSTVNNCKIPSLPCGKRYNVTVSYHDGNCPSTSAPISMDSVPCGPEDVMASVACVTGELKVTWNISVPAENYTTIISRGIGQPLHCNSTETLCTTGGLLCGSSYIVTWRGSQVRVHDQHNYLQPPWTPPCSPTNVSSQLVCSAGIAHVSWAPSANAVKYAMKATSNEQILSCTSSTPNCTLTDLVCGQLGYSVSLTAVTDCGTNSLLASWNAAPGATSYTATVTGPNGFSETCFSSNLTCSFSSLQCASQYNITVTSQDSNCTSSPSQTVLTTGCCGSDKATVSWEAAAGAVAYTVHAQEGSSQHYSSCRSNTTSCQLNQLQCGKVYNLTVMAEDATCNSTGDISTTLMTGRTEEHWTDSITAQGSQCDSAPSSSTNITTCECVHGCERKLSISVKNNFLLIPSGKPTFLFLLLSVQPPVLQLTYLSNMCVAPAQQCSVGLTLWDASASWLRLQEKGIRIAARLQIPAVRSKVSLVVWV
uniref:Fibronectin type-III domain-containing protein n=1 Tax=Dicentrarchus labrax TaxID=13489 RepID=A0A8P4K839_DICLA